MSDMNSFETLRRMAQDLGHNLSLEEMDEIFQQYQEHIKTDLYLSREMIMKDCILRFLFAENLKKRVAMS